MTRLPRNMISPIVSPSQGTGSRLTGSSTVIASCLWFNGCAGYQLGSMLPPDIKTVHVPNFTNKTQEPFIVTETTKAVLEELQLDGSLELAKLEARGR